MFGGEDSFPFVLRIFFSVFSVSVLSNEALGECLSPHNNAREAFPL